MALTNAEKQKRYRKRKKSESKLMLEYLRAILYRLNEYDRVLRLTKEYKNVFTIDQLRSIKTGE